MIVQPSAKPETPNAKLDLRRNAGFLKLWGGQTVSVFGTLVGRAAMSFTAILLLGATPVQMAILSGAQQIPAFLGGLVAGVWVDRLPRRPILIVADLARAALLATIPAAALFGALRIELLYIVAFGTSLLTLLFDVAYQAYLPTLVREDQLLEGNSKLTASASVAEFGGFSIAGWLVQWLSGPITILIDAVSFVVSAIAVLFIRTPEPPPAPSEHDQPNVLREISGGLRTVAASPVLRATGAAEVVLALGQGIVGTVIVLYMVRDLGFPPGILAMTWAVGGVTSFLGALAAAPLARRLGTGTAMSLGLLFSGLGTLLVPLAQGNNLISLLLLIGNQVITDPAHTVYSVNEVSLRQSVVPNRLLGRVSATFRFGGLGASLLGAFAGGLLGELIGLRLTMVTGCALTFSSAFLLFLSPVRRIRAAS